ncbi:hypothetical protein [Sodalis sp.]|uniref:hypothetical protein n=1 Tax=Sodalis sp. (in: enterobacteria) TaxID=1898979 RepID=UPI0038736482
MAKEELGSLLLTMLIALAAGGASLITANFVNQSGGSRANLLLSWIGLLTSLIVAD